MGNVTKCDVCPADATHVAITESGKELTFCDHHTTKYRNGFPVVLRIAEKAEAK